MKKFKVTIINTYEAEIDANDKEEIDQLIADGHGPFDYMPKYHWTEDDTMKIEEIKENE